MKKISFLLFISLFHLSLFGQEKYWILNEDAIKIPDLDSAIVCSDWLHACSYELTPTALHSIIEQSIYPSKVRHFNLNGTSGEIPTLGFSLEQVEGEVFIEQDLDGTGVKVGIIDGGFLNANKSDMLEDIFANESVKFYKDYITPEMEPYTGSRSLDDGHGTEVWQQIAGYKKKKDIQFGLAQGAAFYLARTDHGGFEKRQEEDLLIQALEDMHKMGVKLVNISLGYTEDYTNSSENYTPDQIDGKSTMITKAVEIAAVEKGMLIVVSAGNEGGNHWKTLSAPGDAQHALTVGSSKYKIWDKMNYSSMGPETLDYVKPDITVYSTLGTSFAAPIATGMAACIWQYDSSLSNLEIINYFQKAGNFYPYGNNYVGYGTPTCSRLWQLMNNEEVDTPKTITTSRNQTTIKEEFEVRSIVIYHKKGKHTVQERIYLKPSKDKIKIKRPDGISQSSVLIGKKIVEIIWK